MEGQSGRSLKGSVVALGRLLGGLGQHWYSVSSTSQGQSQSQTVPEVDVGATGMNV